jgi:uncharacterized membrane protein YqjE
VLIYDRIELNRRKTAVVISLFVLATLLFVVYVAMWLTALVVWAATDSHGPAGQEQLTLRPAAIASITVHENSLDVKGQNSAPCTEPMKR